MPRHPLSRVVCLALIALSFASACTREPVAPVTSAAHVLRASQRTVPYAAGVLDAAAPVWLAQDAVTGCAIELDAQGGAILKVYLAQAGVELPATSGGLPVVAEVTGTIEPFALTDRVRPLPIGVSLGNNNECLPGTLGCLVERAGVRYALSANHVLARQNAGVVGEDVMQPSRPDGSMDCSPLAPPDRVARLSEFAPVVYDGRTPNTMDAAIAQLTATDATGATPAGFYGLPGRLPAAPVPGLAIQKLGRTTGLTRGVIKAVNAKVKLTFPSGTALFVDQIITSKAFGDFGDSGALVVTNDADASAVGIVIGGSNVGGAIVTPIGPILSRFGVTIVGR